MGLHYILREVNRPAAAGIGGGGDGVGPIVCYSWLPRMHGQHRCHPRWYAQMILQSEVVQRVMEAKYAVQNVQHDRRARSKNYSHNKGSSRALE